MLCCHLCRAHARPCLSMGWALNRSFAWTFGTVAVLAQAGGYPAHTPTSPFAPSDLTRFFLAWPLFQPLGFFCAHCISGSLMEAHLAQVRAAKERREREEEKKRKAEEAKMVEMMLEAAFDGEMETVQECLEWGLEADCQGEGEYSPLSEASCGGALGVVDYLLKHQADPNSRGEQGRTPLYRAMFNEHDEVCCPWVLRVVQGTVWRLAVRFSDTAVHAIHCGWRSSHTVPLAHTHCPPPPPFNSRRRCSTTWMGKGFGEWT